MSVIRGYFLASTAATFTCAWVLLLLLLWVRMPRLDWDARQTLYLERPSAVRGRGVRLGVGARQRHEKARTRACACLRHHHHKDMRAGAGMGATRHHEACRQAASVCLTLRRCKSTWSQSPGPTGRRERRLGHKVRTTGGATQLRETTQHQARMRLRCCREGPWPSH